MRPYRRNREHVPTTTMFERDRTHWGSRFFTDHWNKRLAKRCCETYGIHLLMFRSSSSRVNVNGDRAIIGIAAPIASSRPRHARGLQERYRVKLRGNKRSGDRNFDSSLRKYHESISVPRVHKRLPLLPLHIGRNSTLILSGFRPCVRFLISK